MKIDGREIATEILNRLKLRVQKLKEKNIVSCLAIILVGKNPQSISYIEQKELKANKIGVKVIIKNLSSDINQNELLKIIEKLNTDNTIHGIIVQRPLPSHIDSDAIDNAVVSQKDVDGFNPDSKFQPPIAEAVIKILESVDKNFRDKKIAVIGKGETGGGPIIKTFEKMGINFQTIDSKTENKNEITKNSDIVISAVGKPNIVNSEIKPGVILVSVGFCKGDDGKMHGDYNEDKIKNIASFYTPTPGGVGPVNVAMLLENLVKATD